MALNSFPDNPEPPQAIPPEQPPQASASLPVMPSSDPAWNAWDLLGLIAVGIVAIVVSTVVVLLAAKQLFYPHADVASLSRNAIVIVAGQALGYLLVFAYMYAIVTRVRRRPDFLAAIHWNLPRNPAIYLAAGVLLSIGLQVFAHFLPIPKNLPIDTLFRTSAEAWMLTIFGITLAPLMEELFFRGFLYPVLEHYLGFAIAVPFTALGFALLHGSQLKFAWGPLLVIFIVGLVLTIVRARKKSVAASLLIHVGYNTTLSGLIFVATGGFRHLEKLKQ